MKIRIKGDSVRFRLTKTEVKALAEEGSIFDTTNFGKVQFTYGVVLDKTIAHLRVRFVENTITMHMPFELGNSWYDNDLITFEHQATASPDDCLDLLLEKDFTCMDNTGEDQSDNYPNPKLQ